MTRLPLMINLCIYINLTTFFSIMQSENHIHTHTLLHRIPHHLSLAISLYLSFTMDEFFSSDEFMVMIVPLIVYWVYSGLYEMLGSLDNYRLHSRRDEDTKNLVSKLDVFKGVLFQQSLQAATTFLIFKVHIYPYIYIPPYIYTYIYISLNINLIYN